MKRLAESRCRLSLFKCKLSPAMALCSKQGKQHIDGNHRMRTKREKSTQIVDCEQIVNCEEKMSQTLTTGRLQAYHGIVYKLYTQK